MNLELAVKQGCADASEQREAEVEIGRLRLEVAYQTAAAAYWKHDSWCCGGCPKCGQLYEAMQTAEKARTT